MAGIPMKHIGGGNRWNYAKVTETLTVNQWSVVPFPQNRLVINARYRGASGTESYPMIVFNGDSSDVSAQYVAGTTLSSYTANTNIIVQYEYIEAASD